MRRPSGENYPDVTGKLLKCIAGKQHRDTGEEHRYKEDTELQGKVHAVKESHGRINDDVTRKANGYPDHAAQYQDKA
jgi:hypothetical protein